MAADERVLVWGRVVHGGSSGGGLRRPAPACGGLRRAVSSGPTPEDTSASQGRVALVQIVFPDRGRSLVIAAVVTWGCCDGDEALQPPWGANV